MGLFPVLDDTTPSGPVRPEPVEGRTKRAANCGFGGGCGGAASLVSGPAGAGPTLRTNGATSSTEAPPDLAALTRNHPCYSEDAHHHFARMHLAVAPACNIQCHYCNRKFDCANESRPGVVSAKLTPAQAIAKVRAVAAEVPELSVIGIAGPGDALANADATYETLRGIREVAPDLTLCLSTNGLALPDHVDRLVEHGVRHVTVTVNMVDPRVGERIYPWVFWEGRKVGGVEGARILSARQLEGISLLARRGVLVKVNAVVIPGVNDLHLAAVVREVRARGAFLVNLLPLISAPEHGTHFGLTGQRGPTPAELERVQRASAIDARLMKHCRQCRADAIGRLGEDRFAEFATPAAPPAEVRASAPPPPARDAAEVREERRAAVERVRALHDEAKVTALRRLQALPAALGARVAVATKGGGTVDQHFGHAREFLVYDVTREGASLVGVRKVEAYCQGGDGDDDVLHGVLRTLEGCQAVLVAKVGHCPEGQLAAAGIEPVTDRAFEPIEAALLGWFEAWALRTGQARPAAEVA
ncbi:MAG: nitrogenase cofactor biosynthesis protein NifB [Anaeromyxobacter sp.]